MRSVEFYYNYVLYEDGKIFSNKSNKFIKQWTNKYGYICVTLCYNGKHRNFYLHRILAESFIENTSSLRDVNHKNGIKSDYSLENLEWMSRSDNQKHAYTVLKRKSPDHTGKPFPSKNKLAKGISKHGNKFRVRITKSNGKYECLGLHSTLEEAMKVYQEAHINKYNKDPYDACHKADFSKLTKMESK